MTEIQEHNRAEQRRQAAEAEGRQEALQDLAAKYVAQYGMPPDLALRRAKGGLANDAWKGATGEEIQHYASAAGTPGMPLRAALRAYAGAHGFTPPPLHPILGEQTVRDLPVRTRHSDSCLLSEVLPEYERGLVEGHHGLTAHKLHERRY